MQISIVINFYNNASAVKDFLKLYQEACKFAPNTFELVLVDDHSNEIMDLATFEGIPNVRVFRIADDIPWNQGGARNIGALEARNRLILFMDIDHAISVEEIPGLLADAAALQLGQRVTPTRRRLGIDGEQGELLKHNINCFLIHRQDFFKVGGYDEIFSGHYSHDDKFFFVCCRRMGVIDQPGSFKLTSLTGKSTKGLDRDRSHNNIVFSTIMATGKRSAQAFQNRYIQLFPPVAALPEAEMNDPAATKSTEPEASV